MIGVIFLLHVLAFASFVLAAIGIPSRVNLVALGLAFWVATLIVQTGYIGGPVR